jgi:hypothetical protein
MRGLTTCKMKILGHSEELWSGLSSISPHGESFDNAFEMNYKTIVKVPLRP